MITALEADDCLQA
jgi:hypothetical protein